MPDTEHATQNRWVQVGFRMKSQAFQAVKVQRISQQIIRQVKDLIANGYFSPGERLPSEREFAKQFGVSRAPVREALRILEALGFVEAKAGKGTFVARGINREARATDVKSWLSENLRDLSVFFDVDEVLQRKAAELAAMNGNLQAIQYIEGAIVEQEKAIIEEDEAQMLAADIAFHHALIEASGNRYLGVLTRDAGQAVQSGRRSIFALFGVKQGRKSVKEHKGILKAIRMHDPREAGRLAARHVNDAKQIVLKLQERTNCC